MSDMTIAEFEDLLDKAYQLKLDSEELDGQRKKKDEERAELDRVILAQFEQFDKTSYRGRRCNVIKTQRTSVSLPKEPAAREDFFAFLKSKKIFEELITVNHQTLNAFYKNEFDNAVEAGNHEFKIPGLEQPKVHEYITYRK